jgi:hypothetical protein
MKPGRLEFEKNSVMYKYGKPQSLNDANMKLVGGKKFSSLKEAFSDLKNKLKNKIIKEGSNE